MKRLMVFALLLGVCPMLAVAAPDTSAFNFDYSVQGPSKALPTVVYNDGMRTYLEMPAGVVPSGAFVNVTGSRRFLPVKNQSPYYVVDAIAPSLDLVTGSGTVSVLYKDPIPQPELAEAEQAQAADQEKLASALTTLNTLLASPSGQALAAEHARQEAFAHGAMSPTGEPGRDPAADGVWTLGAGSLHNQLAEWCRRGHYTLDWSAKTDWTISNPVTLHGSLPDAVKQVIMALAGEGVGIGGGAHTGNRTIVIVSTTESNPS